MMKKIFADKEKREDVPMKNTIVYRIWAQHGADAKIRNASAHMVVPMPDLSWMDDKNQK